MKPRFYFFLIAASCAALNASTPRTLYSSLDPTSISQHLALYELYPDEIEGQAALYDAWDLLTGEKQKAAPPELPFHSLSLALSGMVALTPGKIDPLDERLLNVIETLGAKFSNRKLKGYFAKSEAEILALPEEHVDVARALLLTEVGDDPIHTHSLRTYEALLDLMALQITARLPKNATAEEKVRAINQFIFFEMGFRFPQQSTYSDEIDIYTFLPSVINSRRGVCLGVSLLYLCLAQRLNLHLEIVTPPGHIYVRCRTGEKIRNIETTARGVHVACEDYLDLELCSLKTRTAKEAIGLSHMNQAATLWKKQEHEKALESYSKAEKWLPKEPLILEFSAYNHLFLGHDEEGRKRLQEVLGKSSFDTLSKNTLPEDYLNSLVDLEGIRAVFFEEGEDHFFLQKKIDELKGVLTQFPKFRAGWLSLATCFLKLKRTKEAIVALKTYHALDPSDPSVEYMLTIILYERFEYKEAWTHFKQLEMLMKAKVVMNIPYPKALIQLKRELIKAYPL